jgi:hypothetical protein
MHCGQVSKCRTRLEKKIMKSNNAPTLQDVRFFNIPTYVLNKIVNQVKSASN